MAHPPQGSSTPRSPELHGSWLAWIRTRLAAGMDRLFEIRWIWSLLFLLALTPLMTGPGLGPVLPLPQIGTVAPDDVIAPRTLEFIDEVATRDVREAASASVLPVYEADGRALTDATLTVRRLFEDGRGPAGSAGPPRGGAARRASGRRAIQESSETQAPPEALAYLEEAGFDEAIEARIDRVLAEVFRHRIVGSRTILRQRP